MWPAAEALDAGMDGVPLGIAVACAVLGWDRVRFPTDEILDLAWDCAPSGPGRAEDAAELVLQWQCRGMEVAV